MKDLFMKYPALRDEEIRADLARQFSQGRTSSLAELTQSELNDLRWSLANRPTIARPPAPEKKAFTPRSFTDAERKKLAKIYDLAGIVGIAPRKPAKEWTAVEKAQFNAFCRDKSAMRCTVFQASEEQMLAFIRQLEAWNTRKQASEVRQMVANGHIDPAITFSETFQPAPPRHE